MDIKVSNEERCAFGLRAECLTLRLSSYVTAKKERKDTHLETCLYKI